jgi:pyruvate dehydrogenase E1 component
MAVIILDGLQRMYYESQDIFYYLTLMNENYEMPLLPIGSTEGICRGIYKLSERNFGPKKAKVNLFGSGAILRESLRAQDLLDKYFGISSNVYSVTSYKSLYDDGRDVARWNRLHPRDAPRKAFVEQLLAEEDSPIVAASDYVSAVPLSIGPWVGPHYSVLGTDGFGRSEARVELRKFFEVDAENITLAALCELAAIGKYPQEKIASAIKTLGLDPNKPNQATK